MEDNFYQFTARSLQGKEISMDTYKGKVVLVVNDFLRQSFLKNW